MNKRRKGSLELNWVNKDKSLLYEYDEEDNPVRPEKWVDKGDIRVTEPRNLKLKDEFGEGKQGNMLIKGDNLLALQSLVEIFKSRNEEKVKLVYIDPPFNAQSAFESYEDNLRTSEWLTMMRDRLALLRKLMRRDGVIFAHIDKHQLAHLKVLMDEIFGPRNFISIITWQRAPQRTILGQGQTPINTITEYILCYAKEESKCKINDVPKYIDKTENIMEQYSYFFDPGERELIKEETYERNDTPIKIYEHKGFTFKKAEERFKELKEGPFHKEVEYKDFYMSNFQKIARLAYIQKEDTFQQRLLKKMEDDKLYTVEYTPTRGKHADQETKYYYYKGSKLLLASDYAKVEEGQILRRTDMNNLWTIDEINVTAIAKEGGVNLKRGKKPEELLKRIIKLGSNDGDLVLDSFLGSGTTAAVAHKMGRRWIGIELIPEQFKKSLKRLKQVVSKENPDKTGISKDEDVNWQGGGRFRSYEIGESVLTGKGTINWHLNQKEIAHSLFRMFDYSFKGKLENGDLQKSGDTSNYQIYIGERNDKCALSIVSDSLAIIDREQLEEILSEIKKEYKDPRKIEIYTNKGIGVKKQDLPQDLTVKKVPICVKNKYFTKGE